MIIPPIPPFVYKLGGIFLLLFLIFFSGCYVQKQHDAKKISLLKQEVKRHVEIIEVFQANYDTLDAALKDQNEQIDELGKEHNRKVNSLQAEHDAAIRRFNTASLNAVKEARDEAAALRERMAGLSAAEACHHAWLSVAQ